jgi:DUF4097 and DUF4098 domain-containing protein YvlB
MRRYFCIAVLAAGTLCGAGCDNSVGDVTANESGANAVNGSIQVPAGLHSGGLSTVNGSIHIGDNATVGSANTVNGSISLGAHASADSLTTVNGSVRLDSSAHVSAAVTSVNGSMRLKDGTEVGGAVANVNGNIELTGARVAGGLRTVDGDISVLGDSHVDNGIIIKKSHSWFSWGSSTPKVVIGPGAVVQGELRFERKVQLYVSDKATIGPVVGATVQRFSGEHPPQ